MELTLRAAHKLVEKINAHLKTIEVNPLITVNTYEVDDAATLFKQHQDEFNTNMERVGSLLDIRANVRMLIGEQNAASTIDRLIGNRKAVLERLIAYQRVYNNRQEGQIASAAALEKKIKAGANTKQEHLFGRSDSVSFTVITKDVKEKLEALIADAKRTIEGIEDNLLNQNVQRKISLSEQQVAVLRSERLI